MVLVARFRFKPVDPAPVRVSVFDRLFFALAILAATFTAARTRAVRRAVRLDANVHVGVYLVGNLDEVRPNFLQVTDGGLNCKGLRSERAGDYFEGAIPLLGKLRSTTDGLVPDDGKILSRTIVLSDRHSHVQVEYHVPPTAGHENGLAWLLYALDLE